LPAALIEAEADPEVGAIVLTGAGGFFCSGGDLRQLVTRRELPPAERRMKVEGLHGLIRAIRNCGKPVIAAVNGPAVGVGITYAMQCDVRYVADDAKLAFAFVRRGAIPELAAVTRANHVLSVSTREADVVLGLALGVVRGTSHDEIVVNPAAAAAEGVKFDAGLLQLARTVEVAR